MSESLPGFLQAWPFWGVYAFLLVGALARGQLIYWLARSVTVQALQHSTPARGRRARMQAWLEGGGAQRGIDTVRTWGLPAVSLCYLTVGFQTMVIAAAGVLRIPWWQFTLATVPGALAWALIYSTIGFAAFGAVVAAAAGSPLGLLAILAVLLVLAGTLLAHRRRRSGRRGDGGD